jgi:hypothetical protein
MEHHTLVFNGCLTFGRIRVFNCIPSTNRHVRATEQVFLVLSSLSVVSEGRVYLYFITKIKFKQDSTPTECSTVP